MPKEARPYACTGCNQRFTFPKDLRRHIVALHPQVVDVDETLQLGTKRKLPRLTTFRGPTDPERDVLSTARTAASIKPNESDIKTQNDQNASLEDVKAYSRYLKPSLFGHKYAASVAKEWLSAIGGLVLVHHRIDTSQARDAVDAVDTLMAQLKLVEARHDFERLGRNR